MKKINVSDSVEKAACRTKIDEIEKKIPDLDKYISTNEGNLFSNTINERWKIKKLH